MADRIELHKKLVDILGSGNVYYQPPENVKITYPCIEYDLSKYDFNFADNMKYRGYKQYIVTLMTKEPDPAFVDKFLNLPYSSFDRYFVSDNLHHYVFTIYY